MDQVATNTFIARRFPVLDIVAYEIKVSNAIMSPYSIQEFAPGQCLQEVPDRILTTEGRSQIASIIANILVSKEKTSSPSAPSFPERCINFSKLSISVFIAPFKIQQQEEVHESTSCPPVADFMGTILDMWYEKSCTDGSLM